MSTAASQALVQKLYVAYYGRPADPAGLEAWALAIDANKGQVSTAIVNAFGASAESTALFGNMSTSQKVNAIYKQLFGRDAEPAGLLAWATAIDGGRVSAAGAALEILNGAAGDDKTTINNKLSAAAAFTAALDTTAEITAYSGDTVANAARSFLAGVTTAAPSTDAVNTAVASVTNTSGSGSNEAGKPYVLTTNQDILTGTNSNDNFRAVAGKADGQQDQTTLNSSDIIDGGAGTADALIVNLVGGNYGGGARIKNVETLQIGTNDSTVRTFDYNVNMGSNEITEATKVVYDQINAGEHLSVVNLLKTGEAIPTLSWTNEANSLAGTISADFRQSAVEGNKTAATVELNNVLADPNVATTGRLNIGAGVETLNIVSGGSSAYNTLNASQRTDGSAVGAVDIVSAGFSTNAASVVTGEGVNDDGSLSTVNVTGSRAFGKAATVVTDTTNTNFGLTNRAVAGDVGLDNLQPSASNLVSLAATVTTLNAAEATGDTNIRFTSRVDAAEVNVTYKGGKGNDYVEFQQGNVNATGGDGNDTFAFVNGQSNSTFTTADTIVGGAGADTIQMGVNGSGSYNLDTTEFNNKTGIDVLDLRGATNTVRLADAFVGAADAGLTVRTDKIVQTSDTNTANSSTVTANNGLENASTNTVTLTALSANRAVEFIGGSGSDRIVVNEVSLNSNVKLDGGTNITTTGRFDTITVQDSAVLSRGDLANVKNFEGIVLVKSDTTSARQYTIEVTESFLTNNSGQNKTLQIGTIAAANQNALTNVDTVTIDVSDLLTTSNALKTAGYDRKIDTTSLTAAGVTVQYVANGGAVTAATLQTLGVLASTADASQSLVLASAASAVSNAGAGDAPAVALTASSNVTGTANADNYTAPVAAVANVTVNGGNGTDTLTLTDAGTAAFGANVTAIERLVLANGTNTVTFNAANGFTTITGGTGNDDVDATNLASTALNVSLGDGNDKLTVTHSIAYTGTFAGGNGTDTLVTGAGLTNLSGATVTGFETLNLANVAGASFGSNSLLTQFSTITGTDGSVDVIKVVSGSHDVSGAAVAGFKDAASNNVVDIAAGATLTIAGDSQFGATNAFTNFTGAGSLITTGTLTFGAADAFTGNVTIGGSAAADFVDGVTATARTITGNSAANVITLGDITAAKTVNLTAGGSDTVKVDAAGTASAAVTIQGFQAGATASGGDILSLSYTAATSGFVNVAAATGGNITAGGAAAVANIANVIGLSNAALQISGAFSNAAVTQALTQGALVGTNNDFYYVALDNGADTAIYRFQFADSGANGILNTAAEVTNLQQVVVLTGVADVGTLIAANFA